MRIVFHTDLISKKMGGATISTVKTLEVLAGFGHETAIIAQKKTVDEMYGIPVYKANKPSQIRDFYSWADVVFALRRAPLQPIKEYERWHVPHGAHPIYSVYFSRNVGQPYKLGYNENDIDLVVFNTEWIKEETGWSGESYVLHPPVFKEQYLVTPGDKITQINLARKKGGQLFWEMAQALPDHQFLGVLGKEKDQVVPASPPPNVELVEFKEDVREIYSQTRILLMPSQGYGEQDRWSDKLWTESYGRVGVEAAVSSIPVIAYPTPGIKEALGDQAIYCDMNVESWVHEINKLSDPQVYDAASKKINVAADRVKPIEEIVALEKLLLAKVEEAAIVKPTKYRAYFDVVPQSRQDSLPKSKGKEAKEETDEE